MGVVQYYRHTLHLPPALAQWPHEEHVLQAVHLPVGLQVPAKAGASMSAMATRGSIDFIDRIVLRLCIYLATHKRSPFSP